MKGKIFSIALLAGFLFLPASLFAAGKTELTIHNKTGFNISGITINNLEESSIQTFDKPIGINSLTVIKVKRDTSYDIYLSDEKGNKYGKSKLKWNKSKASLIIERRDFIHESILRTIQNAFRSVL